MGPYGMVPAGELPNTTLFIQGLPKEITYEQLEPILKRQANVGFCTFFSIILQEAYLFW